MKKRKIKKVSKQNSIASDVTKWLCRLYSAKKIEPPLWLKKAHWKPTVCLRIPQDRRVIAIDVITSGEIPKLIYREVVNKLLERHANLRTIVCVSDYGYNQHSDLKSYMEKNGLGLKIIIPSVGVKTVVTTDLDGAEVAESKKLNEEWFPEALLSAATGLTNLTYYKILDQFIKDVRGEIDIAKVIRHINVALEKIFATYPKGCADLSPLLKLESFETLLRIADPSSSEHVVHSFKVFLSGCPVINKFYDEFKTPHLRVSMGKADDIIIEYCWLLTAIFHDIGYPKEKASNLLKSTYDDDDVEIRIESKGSKWLTNEYSTARNLLGSLGAFIANESNLKEKWPFGAILNKQGQTLAESMASIYNKYSRHSVIGAFDLLAEIIKKASAASDQRNHPFVINHAVPAALAILLHDHHLWDDAKMWKLIPIFADRLPLAALLIFADSWDDYRRKDKPSLMELVEFVIDDTGVRAVINWKDRGAFENERLKYDGYKKAFIKNRFKLDIVAGVG